MADLPSLDQLQPAAGGGAPPDASVPAATPEPAPDMGTAPTDPMVAKLSAMPIVQAIQAGKPGAGYLREGAFGSPEELKGAMAQIKTILPQLGLEMFHAEKSDLIVFYNPKEESVASLEKADKAGKIGHYAVPLLGTQHGAHLPTDAAGSMPVDASSMPGGASALAGGLSAPQPAAAPLPAAVQGALERSRLSNAATQPASASALPSQGIMNGLVKRAV